MTQADASTRFAAFRKLFPALQGQSYCDVAARGPVSTTVRDALAAHIDGRVTGRVDKAAYFDLIEDTRARFARLIKADADEIAFTKNVSEGVNILANALPWRAGDNVVICRSLEHPANIFVWQALAERSGIVLREIQPIDNRVPLDKLLAAIDERTRVVTVSSVSFSPGLRFPVTKVGRVCRARNVVFLVDAAQSIGILDTDVASDMVDAMAVSTQKGLLALYGAGFLYVRRELAETLNPAYMSRMGVDLGTAHEASTGGGERLRLAAGARRFDVGNYNYIGACAVNQSMRDLEELGTSAIEPYVHGLARRLAAALEARDVPLIAPSTDPDLAHMVAIGHRITAAHDSVDDPALLDLHARLAHGGVVHTVRKGLLRLSLHAYNDLSDVERICEIAGAWARQQPARTKSAAKG